MKIEADVESVTGDKCGRPTYGSSTLVPGTSAVRPPWHRKTEEKDGGGEGTKATADEGTKSCIRKVAENEGLRAGKSKDDIPEDVRGPSGPVKEVILGRSNLLKNTKDTEVEDRREGPRWKRGGPQGMK